MAKKDGDVIAAWMDGGTVEEVCCELERDLGETVRAPSEQEFAAAYIGFMRNGYGAGRLMAAAAGVRNERRASIKAEGEGGRGRQRRRLCRRQAAE